LTLSQTPVSRAGQALPYIHRPYRLNPGESARLGRVLKAHEECGQIDHALVRQSGLSEWVAMAPHCLSWLKQRSTTLCRL
jgi:hypothetical protein